MTDTENGGEASSPELAELTRVVRALTERVHELEQRLPPQKEPVGPVTREAAPARPAPEPALAPQPVLGSAPTTPASAAHERDSDVGQAPPASWRVGPLRKVEREHLPVILMGAAGGVALLMGTLYFAWYSIQQGWISPEVRVSVTAVFGLCAMAAAWRLAPRGQTTVAASLGGAGLGAWFGAVLVARHSHAFISPATTFALLAVGAALGMAIATHRRLRLFATLAAFAALITPLSIDYYADRLHERMTYQLVVVVFLYAIEHRRRWVELGYIAVLGTWFLLLAWLSEHSGEQASVDVVGWAFAYLVLGHAQSWRLVRAGRITDLLATPRWWLNAYAAWFIGGIWLLATRTIRWQIPLAVFAGVLAMSSIFYLVDPGSYASPMFHLLSGAVIIGAFFIATDPVTAATTDRGRLIYGMMIGCLIYVIRAWGGYPDGVAFAVLLANMCVPFIDYYT